MYCSIIIILYFIIRVGVEKYHLSSFVPPTVICNFLNFHHDHIYKTRFIHDISYSLYSILT